MQASKNFDSNPIEINITHFNSENVTSDIAKSFITAKYSIAGNKKEANVTRHWYFYRKEDKLHFTTEKDANYYIYKSEICHRDRPKETIVGFYAEFLYDLYDQYRKDLKESEKGKSVPYVKERYLSKPKSEFLLPHYITDFWAEEKDCLLNSDKIQLAVTFQHLFNENHVKNFRNAEKWRIMWEASVNEGMHKIDTLEHLMESVFIDVVREDNKDQKLISFRLQTRYIRVGRFINKK